MSVLHITTEQGHKVARPVTSRQQYLALRQSPVQLANLQQARAGNDQAKHRLVQMNYSCLPGPDHLLRGCQQPSTTVGMDIDFDPTAPDFRDLMEQTPRRILDAKDELGLLMLERSARDKGFHLVFTRRQDLSQEQNLDWASTVIGTPYDPAAKDITRVFFTTSAEPSDLLFLDDRIFTAEAAPLVQTATTPQVAMATTATATTAAYPEQTAATPTTDPALTTFKGVPYTAIIRHWFRLSGGEPQHGERNVRLHQLAVALRAICDNSPQALLAIMPAYGLSAQEMQQIVASACKEPPRGLTRTLQQAISAATDEANDEADDDEETDDDDEDGSAAAADKTAASPFRLRQLPPALRASLKGVPEGMHWPVIASLMPIAAACADGVSVTYCDGTPQRLALMTMVLGEQASGKSVCKTVVDLWKRQLDREDADARRREDEWKAKRKARKANEKAPEDPQVLIRVLPVTVSCSTLLRRLKYARDHTLFSFGEELDTLRKTNGAGSWSSKYDIYRLAFDHGEWGQDYNSDQAESGVVSVAYNWTMLGTYGAMRRCFRADNIENGLSSRVIVADMPDNSFAPMPRYRQRSAADEEAIDQGVTRLRSATGHIDTPRLRRAIGQWVEEKRLEAAKDIDHVKDTYRKRAAVIGFRCGVVCHLLAGDERESKATVDFALTVCQLTLNGQIGSFGELLEKEYEASAQCQRRGKNKYVFDELPPVFSAADLQQRKGNGFSSSAMRVIISRWLSQRWVEKIEKGKYRKIIS